ncbi:MAG: DUF6485 family protein [Candidatus Krumholzibacteriaceae bacterium]|jgi:hypothetical protein
MAARCEKLEDNLRGCTCTYKGCPRHGRCCDCLRYHLEARELPACAFPADVEKTYDRSFECFIRTRSDG